MDVRRLPLAHSLGSYGVLYPPAALVAIVTTLLGLGPGDGT